MNNEKNENIIDAHDNLDDLFEEAEDDPRLSNARYETIGPRTGRTIGSSSIRRISPPPRPEPPRGASCSMRLPCDGNWHDVPEPSLPLSTVRGIYARLHEAPLPYDKNLGTIDFRAGHLVVFERLPLWVAEVGYQLPYPAEAIVGNGHQFRFRFNEVCPGLVLELFISIVVGG